MVRAQLADRAILISADEEDAQLVSKLSGATRTKRMPPSTWQMPLTCESIRQLQKLNAVANHEFRTIAAQMLAAEQYAQEQKQAERVEPIRPIPIRPEHSLYAHQIRGYNIALALMGYAPEEVMSNE